MSKTIVSARVLIVLISGLLLWGCQSPYKEFYTPNPNAGEPDRYASFSGQTNYVTCSEGERPQTMLSFMRQGYFAIGAAAFEANRGFDYHLSLREKAKEVSADVVLLSASSAGTIQRTIAIPVFQPGTTSTTSTTGHVNASAYGTGGSAYGTGNYYGQSTTTTSPTVSTQYMPMTIERTNYTAVFMRKLKPRELDIFTRELDDNERRSLERNTGAVIVAVVDSSPAFLANLIDGDIIVGINGDTVVNPASLKEQLRQHRGEKVDLSIIRKGQERHIMVPIANPT
ncbi:MAG TPA: PDZ domain-containing protein [Lacunisphaera sp.]|nr:PDZ domain-containing protein [Lacunisphaera sp.]